MKILYVKFNSERAKRFQLKTIIFENDGKKFVKKQALNSEALKHLKNMKKTYELLSNSIIDSRVKVAPIIEETQDSLTFEFISGESLEKRLHKAQEKGDAEVEKILEEYNALLKNSFKTKKFDSRTMVSDDLKLICGELDYTQFDGMECYDGVSNFDFILSNIIYKNDEIFIIDYEWVFPVNMVIDYIRSRTFEYQVNVKMTNARYKELEENFQNYVLDNGKFDLKRYKKKILTLHGLQELESMIAEHERNIQDKTQIIQNIVHSRGWRLLEFMRKQMRRAKKAVWFFKYIKVFFKGVDRFKIRKLFYHIKQGNFKLIKEKFNLLFLSSSSMAESLDIKNYTMYEKTTVPVFQEPLVSIVIPVYNQWNFTYNCIKSIIRNTPSIPYEIIIADDVSQDTTLQIQEYFENITVVRNEKNLGFLLNCNNAAQYAKGQYILFLNNDTQVQPNWLQSLCDLINQDALIGMVGSKLVYPDGRLQEAGGIIWNDASGWNLGRLDNPLKPEYNYVKEVDYISGAAIMIRRNLWKQIGGFDERYVPAYFEDSDLAFEVRKYGYKVVYQPRSVVVHFEGISHGTDTGSGIKSYQIKNKEKFIDKWQDILEKEQLPNAQDVFLARDRSRNKKHILVIDHYVPHYDQDAGSRTMWQYLEILKDLDYQVTFLGDNFYQHEPYTSMLENMGIEVLYGIGMKQNIESWIQEHSRYFDSIYLLRPHITIKYLKLINKYKGEARVLYNGTDFHFLRLQREYEISKDQAVLKEAKDFEQIEFEIFNSVDTVLTISTYEQEYLNKYHSHIDIKVIPTFIYKNLFPLSSNGNFSAREGILFVGGFAHTPNYVGVKWFLDNIWDKLKKLNSEISLNIVGSRTPDDIQRLSERDPKINVLGFVSDEELEALYNSVKIVIAPLTYGAGVKGKVIEAIAYAVPIVATSIAAEGIVQSDDILSIADDEKHFAEHINNIYTDELLWNSIRTKEIEYANENLSMEKAKNIIKDIF